MNNEDKTRTDQGSQVKHIDLETYNMLVKHMRNKKRINLRAMSYEQAKLFHRLKGRVK